MNPGYKVINIQIIFLYYSTRVLMVLQNYKTSKKSFKTNFEMCFTHTKSMNDISKHTTSSVDKIWHFNHTESVHFCTE